MYVQYMYICYLTLTLNPNLTLKPNPKPKWLNQSSHAPNPFTTLL